MRAAWVSISRPGQAQPHVFLNQAESAAWWGGSYDWPLLQGGWISYGIGGGEIDPIFADLYAYCKGDLIRKWAF